MYSFIILNTVSPIAKIPELGEIVAVKEKNGTKFYRAEVIAKLDNERINVCLIDFGSRDIVHISDVVKPLELLVCIPVVNFVCPV